MAFSYMFLLLLLTSKSSSSYRRYNLNTLCQVKGPVAYVDAIDLQPFTIELHDSPSMSSVLVEQIWHNISYKQFLHCEFTVKTRNKLLQGPNSGLIVAIRELQFRKNFVGECVDYIIFEIDDMNPMSHKICGTITGDEDMHDLKNYFEIPDGWIRMTVHIDYRNFGPYELKLKLTFTAFDDCKGEYKFPCNSHKCISEELYDDSIINCMPPYCADEPSLYRKCGTKKTYQTPNTHILAISAALVLLIFGIAMGWYFLKVCLGYDRFGMRERNVHERVATTPSVVYETVYVPSATIRTLAGTQSNTDEPPSYDSLYS